MRQTSLFDRGLQRLRVPAERRPDDLSDDVRLRWVPKYEGLYAVTDDGRVYSYKAWRGYAAGEPHEIRCNPDERGYYRVNLSLDGSKRTFFMHKLVLLAYDGRPPTNSHECRHLNGDRKDNRAENLEWGTRSENVRDAVEHGTHFSAFRRTGADHPRGMSKVSEDDVIEIRRSYKSNDVTQSELSDEYGIAASCISQIVNGDTWPHVGGPIKGEDY